uniref:Uncharacterized protein n=1 Tax=Capra hircus TaxID=9925 RepID=A0A8C2NGT1_CAPHI
MRPHPYPAEPIRKEQRWAGSGRSTQRSSAAWRAGLGRCSLCSWDILLVSPVLPLCLPRMLRCAGRPMPRSRRESCAPTSCTGPAGHYTAKRPTRRDSSSWI